jgi:hypothetical protein
VHDREERGLAGKPLLLVRFHYTFGVVVAWVFRIGEKGADVIAPAHVALLRFLEEACEQAQR